MAGADAARHVEDHLRAGARLPQRGGIVEVAAHHPDVRPAERPRLRRVPDEAGDGVAPRPQRLHQVRTDEPGAARDERLHSGLS